MTAITSSQYDGLRLQLHAAYRRVEELRDAYRKSGKALRKATVDIESWAVGVHVDAN